MSLSRSLRHHASVLSFKHISDARFYKPKSTFCRWAKFFGENVSGDKRRFFLGQTKIGIFVTIPGILHNYAECMPISRIRFQAI